jgi:hypothetical protein
MWNVYAEVLTLLTVAVVLGGVVFGGTTIAYFLDKHREDPPRPATTGRPNSTATSTADKDDETGHRAALTTPRVTAVPPGGAAPTGVDDPTHHRPAA